MGHLAPFSNYISVVQRSPMSGVYNTPDLDRDEFVNRVLGYWYTRKGNTLPVESVRHLEEAERLYDFYLVYRKAKRNPIPIAKKAGGVDILAATLCQNIYREGSIKNAIERLAPFIK